MLRLHCNGSNSFLFVNAVKMHQFQANDPEIKRYPLCLGSISKDFRINNMKKTGLKRVLKVFSVDYNVVESNNIADIHRYKHDIK